MRGARSLRELTLKPQEKRVLAHRIGGVILREIAAAEGISVERIRQIEATARRHAPAHEWTPEMQYAELIAERC
jgi:DNA-directed RNA polymerase sigma subunit (sigma70/sigma32)